MELTYRNLFCPVKNIKESDFKEKYEYHFARSRAFGAKLRLYGFECR